MELNSIRLDQRKLEQGVWWKIHRNADGSLGGEPVEKLSADDPALLIIPAGLAYERAMDAAREPYLGRIREGLLTDKDRLDMNATALAASVLRGWQNITLNGKAVDWTEALAAELLAHPVWSSLTDFVMLAARWRAAAAAKEEEAAAGN